MRIQTGKTEKPLAGTKMHHIARATDPKTKRSIKAYGHTEQEALDNLHSTLRSWVKRLTAGIFNVGQLNDIRGLQKDNNNE